MYEIYHYEENGKLFQVANCNNDTNMEIYKENQVSVGEEIFVYCLVTGAFLWSFSK